MSEPLDSWLPKRDERLKLSPTGIQGLPLDLVYSGWLGSQDYATSSYNLARDYLNKLKDVGELLQDIPNITTELGEITTIVDEFQVPALPAEPSGMEPNFPHAPTAPVLGSVSPLSVPDEPSFVAADPEIREIAAPQKLSLTFPSAPEIQTFQFPDDPTTPLPDPPSLRQLTLPDAPVLLEVPFEGRVPTAPEAAPTETFSWSESQYSSSLLARMNERLIEFVSGASTGLTPAVSDSIWQAERERTDAQVRKLTDSLNRSWSAAGWNLPGGALIEAVYEAESEGVSKLIEASRARAVADAELEQRNFQFAFTTAVQLESQLMNYANSVAQRAFEAAKYLVESAWRIYEIRVNVYNIEAQIYQIMATVFRDRMQVELIKIERFKAQLDAQRLIGELNAQDVALYRERINAVTAIWSLFKDKLEAVRIKMGGEELKLRQFETETRALEAQVNAKTAEYQGYTAEVNAEMRKLELHKTLAQVFGIRMEGFKALVDARKAKQESDILIEQRIPLELYKSASESFQSLVQAEGDRLKSLVALLNGRTEIFGKQVDALETKANAQVAIQKNEVDRLKTQAEISIEAGKFNISKMQTNANLLGDLFKAGATVASQIASSALSTVNLSGQVASRYGLDENFTTSQSWSVNHHYQHKVDD